MPNRFDAQGTSPGLANQSTPQPKTIHMKCANKRCNSVRAIELNQQSVNEVQGAPHNRTYQCVECRHVWGVPTGGFVAI